jgi:hypothetical protein
MQRLPGDRLPAMDVIARRVDELLWQSGFSAGCDAGRYRDAAAIRLAR